MVVGLESLLVDDDLMMEPAERYQIVGVGLSAFRPGDDVVDLEPVSALAAVGGAGVPVLVDDGPSQGGWDGPLSSPVDQGWSRLRSGGDFDACIAEDGL
jgi:hypothetical protein